MFHFPRLVQVNEDLFLLLSSRWIFFLKYKEHFTFYNNLQERQTMPLFQLTQCIQTRTWCDGPTSLILNKTIVSLHLLASFSKRFDIKYFQNLHNRYLVLYLQIFSIFKYYFNFGITTQTSFSAREDKATFEFTWNGMEIGSIDRSQFLINFTVWMTKIHPGKRKLWIFECWYFTII